MEILHFGIKISYQVFKAILTLNNSSNFDFEAL